MPQPPEDVFDNMPCPDCGNERLIQNVMQSEDVYVDEDGNIERIEPRDSIDIRELLCPECDKTIWEADE